MANDSPRKPQDSRPPQRKRLRHFDIPGHARFLTFSCYQERPLLAPYEHRDWTIQAIERARLKHGFDLWAYVVMPTHVHLLIRPAIDRPSIQGVLTSIKQSVAKRARLKAISDEALRSLMKSNDGNASLRFWQRGGGYDRNLWSAKHIRSAIDYIHSNPVESRLCGSPGDWRWSSAAGFRKPDSGPLRLDVASIPSVQC